MQTFGSFTVREMGFFLGEERPKVYLSFVTFNLRNPSFFSFWHPWTKADTFQAMFVCMLTICSVLASRCLPKVLKSVVRFVTINVINYFCRHSAGYIKPDKPVRCIMFPINLKIDVSFMMQTTSFRPNSDFGARLVPVQVSRNGVVSEDGYECRVIKHAEILPGSESNCNSARG